MEQKLVVFCLLPGRHRAGQQHPAAAEYPLDHFSPAQLAELRGDSAFHMAIGELATVNHIEGLIAHSAESAAQKAVKPTKKAG